MTSEKKGSDVNPTRSPTSAVDNSTSPGQEKRGNIYPKEWEGEEDRYSDSVDYHPPNNSTEE